MLALWPVQTIVRSAEATQSTVRLAWTFCRRGRGGVHQCTSSQTILRNTCGKKISIVPYSISDARFGTHAPDDPFYVSPSLAGSCIAWITFAATPSLPSSTLISLYILSLKSSLKRHAKFMRYAIYILHFVANHFQMAVYPYLFLFLSHTGP